MWRQTIEILNIDEASVMGRGNTNLLWTYVVAGVGNNRVAFCFIFSLLTFVSCVTKTWMITGLGLTCMGLMMDRGEIWRMESRGLGLVGVCYDTHAKCRDQYKSFLN